MSLALRTFVRTCDGCPYGGGVRTSDGRPYGRLTDARTDVDLWDVQMDVRGTSVGTSVRRRTDVRQSFSDG